MRAVRLGVLAVSLAVLVPAGSTACAPDSHDSQKTGGVEIVGKISSALNANQAAIDHIMVTLTSVSLGVSQTANLTKSGDAWTGEFQQLAPASDYAIDANAFGGPDSWGGFALLFVAQARNVNVVAGDDAQLNLSFHSVAAVTGFSNNAPSIDALSAQKRVVALGETVSLGVTASDPDQGDSLSYQWSPPSAGFFVGSTTGTGVSWTAPTTPGVVTLEVIVSDNHGASSLGRIVLIVGDGGESTGNVTVNAQFFDAATITSMSFVGTPRVDSDVTFSLAVQGGTAVCDAGDRYCQGGYTSVHWDGNCDWGQPWGADDSWTPGPATTLTHSFHITSTNATCTVSASLTDNVGTVVVATTVLRLTQPNATYGQ